MQCLPKALLQVARLLPCVFIGQLGGVAVDAVLSCKMCIICSLVAGRLAVASD